MARNCCSHCRAIAIDEVIYARGHTGFMKNLGQHVGGERSDFRRFVYHRTAGRERREGLYNELVDRPVPRSDHADNADWFTTYDCAVALRILELIVLQDCNCRLQVQKSDTYLFLFANFFGAPSSSVNTSAKSS